MAASARSEGGKRKRGGKGNKDKKDKPTSTHDESALKLQSSSIASATRMPTSLQQATPSSMQNARPPKSFGKIHDKKLRAHLSNEYLSAKRAAEHAKLADQYINISAPGEGAGLIELEDDLERTAKVTQSVIRDSVGVDTARKSFSLQLDGGRDGVGLGPYRCDYTRNGRHLALGGRKGHIAAFDWHAGKLSFEINVKETVRDIKWLHNQDYIAVAQKKYAFIYDAHSGAEIHKLKQHVEVHRMQFLPYHFLLATIGSAGYLKYQDVSTGQLVSQHRTGLGLCNVLAQNPLTAVLHCGHANGTVTLWTPNLSTPALKLLAHCGPVSGISINTQNGGRQMVTSGMDGCVKVWDSRMLGRGAVKEWVNPRPASDVQFSQRGLLGMAWSTHVSIYDPAKVLDSTAKSGVPGPYLTQNFPKSEPLSLAFCPFEDVLGVAHGKGFDSLIVPGAGEPNFDSSEANPFENRRTKREREVHSLLDKIQPDMITLDTEMLGQLESKTLQLQAEPAAPTRLTVAAQSSLAIVKSADGRPYARLSRIERLQLDGKAEEAEEALDAAEDDGDDEDPRSRSRLAANIPAQAGPVQEKKRARGRNKALKRYLRKKRKNVIDPQTVAVREKLERNRAQREQEARQKRGEAESAQPQSALDVFSRPRKRARGAPL
ncbi:BING4CT-domain-containing protein [Tilletiaria anomala UBC 951]|uniref:U three protein 7 n=1 Tax=Tilletiaria anomala (strain ATCC 24038 / CBS 436.72 / UBC 951) TaxID=1037660 RepID=A0A066WQS2_TILAU|nr:BING4CT-domain-containing protein [Tilletiaria anomala UBC 951]KDN52995.1 BING4CT-domain-containing protein [Tilletiaria anomala UBC 951]